MIEFTVPGTPVAKGRPRFSRRGGIARTPTKTVEAEQMFAARAIRFRPAEPLTCPLRLELRFFFAVPESWSRWQREAALAGEYQHITKPDADNLLKLVKDALNSIFWFDDKQICDVQMIKRYDRSPRTEIRIFELAHKSK